MFGMMVETLRLLGRGPHRIDPSIIVRIGYPTDQPLDGLRRFYDYNQADIMMNPRTGKPLCIPYGLLNDADALHPAKHGSSANIATEAPVPASHEERLKIGAV
ncbi:hypothetical protein [Paenibacillus spongiae]|uniref:Uncharacterized protein n=1 Tax=Paenibacillus spongiae TaxID=2909671 RepID=A0ABY5SCK6_9BACL|nr:hypothetical protein [Paenibacillus spongiae]UVI30460.1 hypothetical protein L1F29_00780 [Paenibacillus spongiae]